MSEAEEALARARERAAVRDSYREQRPIDYARMQREFPKQKAALTRAVKSGDLGKLILTIRTTIQAWDETGAWPDDWARWQRALDDKLGWNDHVDIRDLA